MAPYLHKFLVEVQKLHFFSANLNNIALYLVQVQHNLEIDARTAASKSTIWEEFSEQHYHRRTNA